MSLRLRFELLKSLVNVTSIEGDGKFPGNANSSCTGQVLTWFRALSGNLKSGTGLSESLLSPQQQATQLHFEQLNNGNTRILASIAEKTVNMRGQNSAENIKDKTPWSGKYKLYIIASSKGSGHALGVYFPWTGRVQFYDPNLLVCEMKKDDDIYPLLSQWVRMYDGLDAPDSIWGHEDLYVIPESKLKTAYIV